MAERRWVPGFVRRRPFGWAFASSLVAALLIGEMAPGWRLDVETDVVVWIVFVIEAVSLLLPVIVAVRWRGAGRRARRAALVICALWGMLVWDRAAGITRDVREFIPNMWAVKEMLREPRRAMGTPPADAAARALAAGDSSFLAVGGSCRSAPGVSSAVARRRGVRVIRGTHHDGQPLTSEHLDFQWHAYDYAMSYNAAVAERLAVEAASPDGDPGGCLDPTPTRGRAPLFWP